MCMTHDSTRSDMGELYKKSKAMFLHILLFYIHLKSFFFFLNLISVQETRRSTQTFIPNYVFDAVEAHLLIQKKKNDMSVIYSFLPCAVNIQLFNSFFLLSVLDSGYCWRSHVNSKKKKVVICDQNECLLIECICFLFLLLLHDKFVLFFSLLFLCFVFTFLQPQCSSVERRNPNKL